MRGRERWAGEQELETGMVCLFSNQKSVSILWFLQMGVKTSRGQMERQRNKGGFVCLVDVGGSRRGNYRARECETGRGWAVQVDITESKWEWELRAKVDPQTDLCCLSVGGGKGRSEIVALDVTLQGRSPVFLPSLKSPKHPQTSRKPSKHLPGFSSSHKPQLQHTGCTYWLRVSVTPPFTCLAF